MKLRVTLLLSLIAALSFTAVAQTNTPLVMASVVRLDSTRVNEPVLNNQPAAQNPVFVKYTEKVNLASLTRTSDSLRMEDSVAEFNHLKMLAGERSKDSANYVLLVKQIDTIRSKPYAQALDSMKQQFKAMGTDTLKQQLKLSQNKLFKGPIYTEIASRYLDFDTLSNKHIRANYQTQSLNYTMQALHQYSMYNDTSGMRISFDALSKVYFAQRKYSEAKWFILQSNTLSRIKNDVPNTISSLIALATVKTEIKDYDLAMGDLNEALQLAQTHRMPKTESEVLRHFAMLYSRLKNYPKETLVLKKRDSVEASIQKQQDAAAMARLAAQDSLQRKKTDSVLTKKKVYISSIKRLPKASSAGRIASL